MRQGFEPQDRSTEGRSVPEYSFEFTFLEGGLSDKTPALVVEGEDDWTCLGGGDSCDGL